MTYSHDMKKHSPHIMTMSFMRVMGVRMVVQIRSLLGVVEFIIVVVLTKPIIWCYWRRDRILL